MRRDELRFFRRRRAPEHCVAMGKTPEALDDLLVTLRVHEILAQLSKQLDRARLHRAILAVLKRHVEEYALLARELLVETCRDRLLRNLQRERIGGEGTWRAAKH